MRRRFLFVLTGLLGCAAMLYSGFWFIASGNLRDGVESWAADRRAAGWKIGWSELSIDGFPLALRARVTGPRGAGPNGVWDWRGPTLVATSRPWNVNRPNFVFSGHHIISVTRHGMSRDYAVTASEAMGNAQFQAGIAREISIQIAQFDILAPEGEKITGDALSLRFIPRHPNPPGVFISIAAAGIVLPDGPHAVLGRNIGALDADLKLLGVSAFKPSSRLRLSAALGDWRDAGGTIEIKRLHLDWGGMKFDGDGAMALDSDLQPVGAMKARIQGYRALVDGLVGARQIPARDADMAKFVLNMVARATPGGKNTVTVPVTIQNRRLFIGPGKLMELPRIKWEN